jgi:hypothetical protein
LSAAGKVKSSAPAAAQQKLQQKLEKIRNTMNVGLYFYQKVVDSFTVKMSL